MKKIITIAVLSLIAFASQAQQEYDTVIYYPPQIRNQPTVWSPNINYSIRYDYFSFTLFDLQFNYRGCPMDDVNGAFVVSLRLCDSTLFPLFYNDSHIPYLKQINGFAQPYHFDSVVTILGVAARMCMYGDDQVDPFNQQPTWRNATKLFKIQDTSMSIAYDSIVPPQNGHYVLDQANFLRTNYLNYDSTFTQVYFRRLNPLRLQDFCISFTVDSCNNYDLVPTWFNHTFSWYDPDCSGRDVGVYTGLSPLLRWDYKWIKFSDNAIYSRYQKMHIMMLPIILVPHVASLPQVELDASCSIFPNPAKDKLSVQSIYKVKNIQIIDISGKEVLRKQINNFLAEIDVSALSAGTYIIKLNSDKGIATKQVVIE